MKLTTENQIRAWWFHILGSIMMLGLLWYLKFDPIFTQVFVLFWILYTLPTLILYIEYLLKNWGQEIDINKDGLVIRYKNGEVKTYKTSDLNKVILYKSAALDKGGIPLLSTESFYYIRIKTKEGVEIIITCLLSHNLDEIARKFAEVPFERRKTIFALILFG